MSENRPLLHRKAEGHARILREHLPELKERYGVQGQSLREKELLRRLRASGTDAISQQERVGEIQERLRIMGAGASLNVI